MVECQVVRDAFDRLRADEQAKQAIVVGLRDNCVNIPENLNATNKEINIGKMWAVRKYLKSYKEGSPTR